MRCSGASSNKIIDFEIHNTVVNNCSPNWYRKMYFPECLKRPSRIRMVRNQNLTQKSHSYIRVMLTRAVVLKGRYKIRITHRRSPNQSLNFLVFYFWNLESQLRSLLYLKVDQNVPVYPNP